MTESADNIDAAAKGHFCVRCGDILATSQRPRVCVACVERGYGEAGFYGAFPFIHNEWRLREVWRYGRELRAANARSWTAYLMALMMGVLLIVLTANSVALGWVSIQRADVLTMLLFALGLLCLALLINWIHGIGRALRGLDVKGLGVGQAFARAVAFVIVGGFYLIIAMFVPFVGVLGVFFIFGFDPSNIPESAALVASALVNLVWLLFFLPCFGHLLMEFSLTGPYSDPVVANAMGVFKRHPFLPFLSLLLCTLLALSGLLFFGLGVFVTGPLALTIYACVYMIMRPGLSTLGAPGHE